MYMWGVTLMFLGGLSFVLPLLGRQFVVVTALGLTGMGGSAAGVLLFVVGAVLFFAARQREQEPVMLDAILRMQQSGEISPALQRVLKQPPPAPSNEATHAQPKPERNRRAYAAREIQQVLEVFRSNLADGRVMPLAIRRAMPSAEITTIMKRVAALRLQGMSDAEAGEIALLELMQDRASQ